MTASVDTTSIPERILDEATTLFVQHGYFGVAMRQIATAAAVSKPGLYYHFADKERLFLAILMRGIGQIGDLVDEALAEAGTSARDRVHRVLLALLTKARGSQRLMRLAEQDANGLSDASRTQMHATYRARFIDPIRAVLRAGTRSGEIRPIDVDQATWLLLGLAATGLSAPPERVPELVDTMVRVYFDGVAAPSAPTAP